MADFSLEGLAQLRDNVSDALVSIAESARGAGSAMRDTSFDADLLESEIDRLVDTSKEGKQLQFLQREIENLFDQEDIASAREMRNQIIEVGRRANLSAEEIDNLSRSISGTSRDAIVLREALEDVIPNKTAAEARTLDQAISSIVDSGDHIEIEALKTEIISFGYSAGLSAASIRRLVDAVDDVGDEALESAAKGEVANTVFGRLNRSLQGTALAGTQAAIALELLDEAMEDVNPSAARLALDLGIVHISLQNIMTTVPLLSFTFGVFIQVILGLTTALIGLTAAITGLLAVGLLEWAEAIDEQFASVEGTMEAMQVIVKALGGAIRDALAPLTDARLGGTVSSMEFFMDVMGGLIDFIHIFADGLADIVEMDEVQDFIETISSGMLEGGTEDSGLAEFMDALQYSIRQVLPVLEMLLVRMGDKLPDVMRSWADTTARVGPEVIEFAAAVVDLLGALATMGSFLLDLVLPAITVLIRGIADLIRWINQLPGALTEVVVVGLVLLRVFAGVFGWSSVLIGKFGVLTSISAVMSTVIGALASVVTTIATALGISVVATVGLIAALAILAGAVAWVLLNMGQAVEIISDLEEWIVNLWKSSGPLVKALMLLAGAALAPVIAGVLGLREALKFILNPAKTFNQWIESITGAFDGMLETLIDIAEMLGLINNRTQNGVNTIGGSASGARGLGRRGGGPGPGPGGPRGGAGSTINVSVDARGSGNGKQETKRIARDTAKEVQRTQQERQSGE